MTGSGPPEDIEPLWEALSRVSSWEDWSDFEKRLLRIAGWPLRSLDAIEADLKRQPRTCNGRLWEPCSSSYDISSELEHFFEQARWRVFERLDPEAAADNARHPERFAMRCVACRLYVREPVTACDFCGMELVPLPLNE